MSVYLAWMRERKLDGWCAYEIEADSYEEAEAKAVIRFAGTDGFTTLEVDKEPTWQSR